VGVQGAMRPEDLHVITGDTEQALPKETKWSRRAEVLALGRENMQ